jgi:antirestriction protein ArdC
MARRYAGTDRYWELTQRIIEVMKEGRLPWARPWQSESPRNWMGRPYRGVNALLLELTKMERNYTTNRWVTFAAAKRLGGTVRMGERGTMILKYHVDQPREAWQDEALVGERQRWFVSHLFVFNLDQTDGLDPLRPESAGGFSLSDISERCRHIIQRSGVRFFEVGDRALYQPEVDSIYLPPWPSFRSETGWAATLFHELTHATGHPTRLNRDLSGRFGDRRYAAEELIAELGSAFACARIGAGVEVRQTAAYLQSWISLLEQDARALVTAASHAQAATDWLFGPDEHSVDSLDEDVVPNLTQDEAEVHNAR